MTSHYDILLNPVVTEKATVLKDDGNVVTFAVLPSANKKQIKDAVESIFKVKVKHVRTMSVNGKRKRRGMIWGKQSNWAKAYVTLAEGQTIELFEGV